ncbi:MAG: tripartite tricarboxylate transporter substrate-binding protein [Burkholderiales bacterium]
MRSSNERRDAHRARARNVAVKLGELWGQQALVENRPGANGVIGLEMVVRAARDGYTLAVVVAMHVINPGVYAKMPTTRCAISRRSR